MQENTNQAPMEPVDAQKGQNNQQKQITENPVAVPANTGQSNTMLYVIIAFLVVLLLALCGAVAYLLVSNSDEAEMDDDLEPTIEVTIEPTEEEVEPTEAAVVPTEDPRGTVTGSISGPPTDAPGEHQFLVCAENVDTGSTSCTEEITILPSNYIVDYELKLAPGSYEVYSYNVAAPDWLVYYSEMVTCGFEAGCPDDIIVVDVVSGETLVDIDPTDFYTVR